MSDTKNWWETGYAGAEREAEKGELGYGPTRFWLKPKAERQLVFIDDSPFCFWEHQFKNERERPDWVTCIIKLHNECGGCGAKGVQKAEYVGHLTAIDITGYVDRNKVDHKYELIEFCPKTKVMNKLKSKKDRKGSLIGQLCTITRSDDHAPNTGDDLEFDREVKMEELYKLVTFRGKKICDLIEAASGAGADAARVRKFLCHNFQVPAEGEIPARIPLFNYAVLHAPLEPAALLQAVAGAQSYTSKFGDSGGQKPGGAGVRADEDIPF